MPQDFKDTVAVERHPPHNESHRAKFTPLSRRQRVWKTLLTPNGWIAMVMILIMLSLFWPSANATGVPPPPKPTTGSLTSTTTVRTDVDARAAAGAISGSHSNSAAVSGPSTSGATSTSAGGSGGAGGVSTATSGPSSAAAEGGLSSAIGEGGNASNGPLSIGGDSSNTSARAYVLPPPVFTPALPVTCANAQVSNEAFSIGWSAFSVANGRADTTDCTLIAIRTAFVERCMFASAKKIDDLMVKKYLPAFEPEVSTVPDLHPDECANLKRATVYVPPAPAVQAPIVPLVVPVNSLGAVPSDNVAIVPAAKPVTQKPISVKKKSKSQLIPASPSCPDGQALLCRPKN